MSSASASSSSVTWTNFTRTFNTTIKTTYFNRRYNRVVYVVTLATFSLLLMVILILLGPFRRRSRNMFLVGAVWASQVLPFSIIAHTLGLMQSPPYENRTYAIWAMLCLLVHGISTSTLYVLPDKELGRRQTLQEFVLLYLGVWSMYLHADGMLSIPLLSILGVASVKFMFRLIQASFGYSPSCRYFGLRRRTKLVADFMNFEHELSDQVDPTTMEGYEYLVKGEEDIEKFISSKREYLKNREKIEATAVTVKKIWQSEKAFVVGSEGEEFKDMCLSFALFRLLAMRCRGIPLHRKHCYKTWVLVRDGLLNQHERGFHVIENELSFLYDYFYTQYPLLFSDGKFFVARTAIYAFLELAQVLACLSIIILLAIDGSFNFRDYDDHEYGFCRVNRKFPIILRYDCSNVLDAIHLFCTSIFVVLYVVLQIFQFLSVVFSNWAKVWLLCKYVQTPTSSLWNGKLEILLQFVSLRKPSTSKPWRRKMEQYDFLSAYRYRPTEYFVISAFVDMPRRGQQSQDCKKLNPLVKSAVFNSLIKNGPEQLTNGLSSLQRNKIDSRVFWACRLKSTAECILVWHVATSFCALEEEYGQGKESPAVEEKRGISERLCQYCARLVAFLAALLPDVKRNREVVKSAGDVKVKRDVAECLSRYCAYLVAFLPALLLDPTDVAEVIFDKAVRDARTLLDKCGSSGELYGKLKKLGKKKNGKEPVEMESRASANKPDGEVVVGIYPECKDFGRKGDGEQIGEFGPELKEADEEQIALVEMGATLGMQLVSVVRDEAQRWTVLEDFWAEMMLFLAPSSNVMAHVESLGKGGEFITHLWALITHIGGIQKDSDSDHLRDDNPNSLPKYTQEDSISGPPPMDEKTNPVLFTEKMMTSKLSLSQTEASQTTDVLVF